MKVLKNFIIIAILIVIYIYIIAIDSIPESIVLFEGDKLEIPTIAGIKIESENKDYQAILTTSNDINSGNEKVKLAVNLFNKFTVKTIDVDLVEETTVIPMGNVAGIKLYTNGVLVIGMSEITDKNNIKIKPYEQSGIEEGDMIVAINKEEISNTNELIKCVNSSNGESLEIEYIRDGKTKQCSIIPVETEKNVYKIGLWVRDSAAGVGTITMYEPSSNSFVALGHGITDVDTESLIDISEGEIVNTNIVSIIKGEKNNPGKIQGSIVNQETIGTIEKNTEFGIYGKITNKSYLNIDYSKQMKVASRDKIKEGKASIVCSIDGENTKEYEIEIKKIYRNNNYNNKSMLIEVTDEELLRKTRWNNTTECLVHQLYKIINLFGAVTHVLVSSPTTGYAVFADMMLKEMKEVD